MAYLQAPLERNMEYRELTLSFSSVILFHSNNLQLNQEEI
jgi:hypothetical protein